MVGLPFTPQTRLKWLWVWFFPCTETPGLSPVLPGIKGNLFSAVNYVTGNYVQITIKVWVLSSSRKVPVYIHKLLLSSFLGLEISGAACELCSPLFFFSYSGFGGITELTAAPVREFPRADSTCLSLHNLQMYPKLIPPHYINSPVNKDNLLRFSERNKHI